jgi:hypothetical protein
MEMSKESTYVGRLGDVQQLLAKLSANIAEIPHLEGSLQQLGVLSGKAQEAFQRQAALTASKQEATKELQALLSEAMRLANVLRLAVKQHYGIRAEKLAEFGMQPFRGRKRAVKPVPEEPEALPTSFTL